MLPTTTPSDRKGLGAGAPSERTSFLARVDMIAVAKQMDEYVASVVTGNDHFSLCLQQGP